MADLQGTEAPEASQGTEPPQGSEAPKGITNEDMNRAITARFKDFEKKLSGQFESTFGGLSAKLEESLSAKLVGLLKPQSEDGEPEKVQPDKGKESPDLSAFKRQQSELRNELKALREENLREKQATREAKLRQSVTEALATHGITGGRAKHALGHLVDVSKLIKMSEDGQPYMADEFGDPVDIDTGLKAWANTEDAKIYIPPRGISGSGGSNQTSKGGAAAPATPFSQAAQLLASRLAQG